MRRLFVSLIVLTFLLIPLMIVGLNPAAAASYRGGGGGTPSHGGSGGDKGKVGVVKVQVSETVEVISQVTSVIPVVQVINVPSPPPGPLSIPYPVGPVGPQVMYTAVEYEVLLALIIVSCISILCTRKAGGDQQADGISPGGAGGTGPTFEGALTAVVSVISLIFQKCTTGKHIPKGTITVRNTMANEKGGSGKISTKDIEITKTVDSTGVSGKVAK